MNTLESYRVERGLTYEAMAQAVGMQRSTVWKHCQDEQADAIPGESAIKYHRAFGIPLESLRPDLYRPAAGAEQQPMEAA